MEIPPSDPFAAAIHTPRLDELPSDAPGELAELRRVWDREREVIRSDLAGKLQQSLQMLEAELTRARVLDEAKAVRAWREGLAIFDPLQAPAVAGSVVPEVKETLSSARDRPFENSLGMKFVPVPGTEVLFCIHETRRRDFETYAKDTRTLPTNWDNQTTLHGYRIKDRPDDHPVVYISWDDAQAFCRWLSEEEDRTYRLPTDREWSIALGIGHLERWEADTTPETVFKLPDHYPWGEGWPPPPSWGNFRDRSYGEHTARKEMSFLKDYEDGFPTTAPVMSFEPNQFGLCDLGGNVWEWVEDWFSDERKLRVLRGGSWGEVKSGLIKSSFRRQKLPEYGQSEYHGFRVVLDPFPDKP